MKAELTVPDELTREIIEGVIEGLRPLLAENVTRHPVPDILDKKGLAAYLKVSVSTVNKLVSNKQIPYVKIGSGQSGSVRFYRRVVDNWLLKKMIPAVNDISEKQRATLRAVKRAG